MWSVVTTSMLLIPVVLLDSELTKQCHQDHIPMPGGCENLDGEKQLHLILARQRGCGWKFILV